MVDDEDYDWLIQWKWCCSRTGYAVRTNRGKTVYMHREVANTQPGIFTDHINGNRLDNRRGNLRHCSNAENLRNSGKRHGKNEFKGVQKIKNRWYAYVSVDGKNIYVGGYATPEEAAHAYDDAVRKYHGEFAHTNF